MAKPVRVALYARVSTDKQSTDTQLRELRQVAEAKGWEVVAEYTDAGVSGSKRLQDRPKGAALMKDATRRSFDVVASWSVDRLGRSLQDLIGTLSELHGRRPGPVPAPAGHRHPHAGRPCSVPDARGVRRIRARP